MTRLGELVEINPRGESSRKPHSFIAIADIDHELAVAKPRDAVRGNGSYRKARPGDVLFARISPSMENGKVAIVPELETDGALVSGELLVLRPKPGVDPRWIWAFLRQERVRTSLKGFMLGSSGRQRLRSEVLEKLEVPVPDPGAWAAEIDALGHLDEARRMRREARERIRRLPGAAAAAIATGARLAPLGSLGFQLRPGTAEASAQPGPVQVLHPSNLIEGRVGGAVRRFLAPSPDRPPDLLREDDLLVTRFSGRRGQIGRCAVYEEEAKPTTYGSSLFRVRGPEHDPHFLWAWLQSASASAAMTKVSQRRNNRYALTAAAMESVLVPRLRGVDEARIGDIARACRRLAVAGDAQAVLLDRLVQALLATAFHGPLETPVPETEPRVAAAIDFLPHAFEVASPRQQELWRRVSELEKSFGLSDLAHTEADYAWVQHCLAIFEQLGLVVREAVDESYCWRQPDLELEVLD